MTEMTLERPRISPVIAPLPAAHMKAVWTSVQKYTGNALNDAVTLFAIAGKKMRPSATLEVNFERSPQSSPNAFALVNWFVNVCQDSLLNFVKNREANRDTGGVRFRSTSGGGGKKAPVVAKKPTSTANILGQNGPAPPGGGGR